MPAENPKKIKSVLNIRLVFVAIGVAAVGSVIGVWLLHTSSSEPSRVTINGATVRVEVADTPRERTQGLSGRESLSRDHGMLFVFDEPGTPGFHMKDMHFSIDIIWLDRNRNVVDVTRSIAPDTYPKTFSSRKPMQYALEVPAGFSEKHAVTRNDTASFDLQ